MTQPTTKTAPGVLPLQAKHLAMLRNFDNLPDSAEVPDLIVAALLSVSRQTVWKWAGSKLPQPIHRGATARWKVGPLRQMINPSA